jgi:putative ABC transport system substrate-binding protein
MKRRNFLLGLSSVTLCSLAARAQQNSFLVGVLDVGKEGSSRAPLSPAWARLTEMGFVEGRNLTIEYRGADFQQDRLPKLVEELVERRVAAIITGGGPATVAAKSVTKSVPIIFGPV